MRPTNNDYIDIFLIEKLLESNFSTYQIAKENQIPASTISNLRSGKRDLGGLTINNALKLSNYARENVIVKASFEDADE